MEQQSEKNTQPKIGITGGIGSGKSYVCQLLRQRGIEVYDCDAAAKMLMRTDTQLRRQITALIGPDAYLPAEAGFTPCDGPDAVPTALNKAAVARFLLASTANAEAINAIVHPAVFRHFEQSGLKWVESAILFQCGMRPLVDRVVVVTAPLELRLMRVAQRDHISREKALEWVEQQWPQERLVQRADYVVENDGVKPLDPQLDSLMSWARTAGKGQPAYTCK